MKENTTNHKGTLMNLKEVLELMKLGAIQKESNISDAEYIACGLPVMSEEECMNFAGQTNTKRMK